MSDHQKTPRAHWTAHPHWAWLFGFLGILLTIVNLIIGGALQQVGIGRPSRALTVTVAHIQLLDMDQKQILPDLHLTFHGRAVSIIYNMDIEISNSGSSPFLLQDFQQPITIAVNQPYSIVDMKVLSNSGSLEIQAPIISANTHNFTINQVLMNPGDTIELSLVTASPGPVLPEPEITVTGHIIGLENILLILPVAQKRNFIQHLLLIVLSLSLLAAGFAHWLSRRLL